GLGSDRYAHAGALLAEILARMVALLVDGLTAILRIGGGIINGLRKGIEVFRPSFEVAGKAIRFVAEEIGNLIADVTGVTDRAREGGSAWSTLGQVLGFIAGLIGAALADAITVVSLALQTVFALVRAVIYTFKWLGTTIGEIAAKIYLFFSEDIPRSF